MKDLILKHKIILAIFFVSVATGGFVFFALYSGVAAMVGARPIWKKDFNETIYLMAKYYDASNHHMADDVAKSEIFKDKDLLKQAQKEAMTRLIEYKILTSELERIKPDWEKATQLKIEKAVAKIKEQEKFEEGIKILYGINFSDFKDKVLMPQAQTEVLSEEFKNQNKSYEQWMKKEKENTNVKIMIDGLEWKDGEVVIEKQ